jgi:hypothetical protein
MRRRHRLFPANTEAINRGTTCRWPVVNHLVSPPNPSSLEDALIGNRPVTNETAIYRPRTGHASWQANKLVISGEGLINYWYIPAVPDCVSYCVVHRGAGDAYVISEQYGGCEYHELYNANDRQLAFLHVYKSGGRTANYTIAPGWVLRCRKLSSAIAQLGGMNGSNWSVSCIDRSTTPPTVDSKFIHVEGYPNLRVTLEDTGDPPQSD